jgi:HPt (histidine-containing phosphotransfer) domain-containing protein
MAEATQGAGQDKSFLDRFIPPPIFAQGPEAIRRARTGMGFVMVGGIFAAIFTPQQLRLGNPVGAAVDFVGVLLAAWLIFSFKRLASLKVVAYGGAVAMTGVLYASTWLSGGLAGPAWVLMPAVPLFAMLIAGTKAGTRILTMLISVAVITHLMAKHGIVPPSRLPIEKLNGLRLVDTLGGIVMTFVLASVFASIAESALALVEKRNKQLASLFDNMQQAIFTIGRDGKLVGEYSAATSRVFNQNDLLGVHVNDLIFKDVPEYDPDFMAFTAWVDTVGSATPDTWEMFAELVPPVIHLDQEGANERYLKLEVQPIFEGKELARTMVLVTDDTIRFQVEREASRNSAAHERDMAAMKKLLTGGAQLFVAFLKSASARLDAFQNDLGSEARSVNSAEIEVLFQHAHTVKGEAKAFELSDLEATCHELEEKLSDLREPARERGLVSTEVYYEEIIAGIQTARDQMDAVKQRFIEASPIGAAVLDQISVNRNDIEALEGAVEGLAPGAAGEVSIVKKIAQRLASRPFGEAVSRLQDGVPAWAAQLEKRANFVVEGNDVLVPPGLMRILPGCLTHMVRNCLAHGIETPEDRETSGKDEVGTIRVTCMAGSAGPNILIEDDGAGLRLDKLREKAKALGMDVAPGREWELIFESGMSTAEKVDDISGRGVGMAAVKGDIERAGYELDVHTTKGKGTMFIIRHVAASRRTIPPPGGFMAAE